MSKKASSPLETEKVKRGGIKKKSQIKALKIAANKTGYKLNRIAKTDTVKSKINATAR